MRRATALRLSLGALLAACGGSSNGNDQSDGGDNGGACVQTAASTAQQPFPQPAGNMISALLCPAGRVDWYAITVPAGMNLTDLDVGYPTTSTTKVALQATLYQSDGTTAVSNANLVDTMPSDGVSVLGSTFLTPAGNYLLAIQAANKAYDVLHSYTLKLGFGADPDTHEPNDTQMASKPIDALPSWFAYAGDLDWMKTTVPAGSTLLEVQLSNPMMATLSAEYMLLSSTGKVVGQDSIAPGKAIDQIRLAGGAGDYFMMLAPAPGPRPDRTPANGYTVGLIPKPELDPHDTPTRNDTPAQATCLSGGANGVQPCPGAYAGSATTYSTITGQIGSIGDQDVYRLDVSGGVAAVLQAKATMASATNVRLAIDLLVPDANSPCTQNSDCEGLALQSPAFQCTSDTDCEVLGHTCLVQNTYKQCPAGMACRLCSGGNSCVPTAAGNVCAGLQYHQYDSESLNTISISQPLLQTGPVYLVVHAYGDADYAYGVNYTFDVSVIPEPDPNDVNPAKRNNFYDPYPPASLTLTGQDQTVSASRAVDISAAITAQTAVTGYVSYQNDEDWFVFNHPCPGATCGLQFTWTQPPSSPLNVEFVMFSTALNVREAWGYTMTTPTGGVFGVPTAAHDGTDWNECSFVDANSGAQYYIVVRDQRTNWLQPDPNQVHYLYSGWDAAGSYSFKLSALTAGCPGACTYSTAYPCACYNPSTKRYCDGSTFGP